MASAVFASGSATIYINPLETEAVLVFTPDPTGDGWDIAAINKLASEQSLPAFSDPKGLETFLAKAARAKNTDPVEMTFAQGIEPEESRAESVQWEALPVPDDMAAYQAETLDDAPPPEVYTVRTERIKHEAKVKKAGALPFMAAKEETAVTWEKKEIREKIEVEPYVMEVKYADKGALLGTIVPAFPGKMGKNVFGRPIQPQPVGLGSCLFGKGVYREKGKVYAQFSGFVRIGENWADMVPLSRHSYKISIDSGGLTFFLEFEPGQPHFSPPAGSEILLAAVENGAAAGSLVTPEEIDKAIARALKTGESFKAFPLSRIQKAEACVRMTQDKTLAVLHLQKGVAGGSQLEMKAISQALKDTDVRGYDTETLKAAIQDFMRGGELELNYVLAEGRPSTRGTDRETQVYASTLPEDEKQEVLDCISDWQSRNSSFEAEIEPNTATDFAFVKEGALVARVIDSEEGEQGVDVFGNVIPGIPGNDPDIKLFGGLKLHGSDIIVMKPGLLIIKASEKSFHGEVIDYQDAEFMVRVSPDAMEAYGDFKREAGAGAPLSLENAKKAFASIGVIKGINWREVEKGCAHARAHGSVSNCLVARGEAPIAEGGNALKWLVNLTSNDNDEKTAHVKAGTPIVLLSEPFANGREGFDVRGNTLDIGETSALPLEHDDSIRQAFLEQKGSPGKIKQLIAARSGELLFIDGHKLKITSVKTISTDASGEVRFSGEIQVDGNVLDGCKIFGGSNLTVDGFAGEALISVGGKAVVKQGVKGNGRGSIRSRAGVVSAFVERASILSMGDIQLDKGAIASSVKTNGKLIVAAENGKLFTGVYQARHGIDAADIGSEKGGRTAVSFGQDYLLKNEINVCEEQIAKLNQSMSQMDIKLKSCLQKKAAIPDELKNEKMRLVELQKQLNLKIFNMKDKFEEHFDSEIRVRGTIFPGVVIESHNRYYEIKQKRDRVIFYFDRESGRIKDKPLN